MARLQILELPAGAGDDRPPFVLVIDEYQPRRYILGAGQTEQVTDEFDGIAERIGARAVLTFVETVDIPASVVEVGSSGPVEVEGTACADVPGCDGDCCATRNIESELKAASEVIKRLTADRDDARMWARHGYEIGQKHCGWSDHGVAPDWLTEGWPNHFDSCEHLKQAAELEKAEDIRKRVAKECKTALLDALGMDHTRDWDDIRNAAAGLRKERDAQFEALERVRWTSSKPEAMDAHQEHPTVWKDGYHSGVLAAKGALRPRDEPTVKP